MNSDLVEFTVFLQDTRDPLIPLEADYRKYPQSIRRSADRAGALKIDCLPNDPAPVLYKLAPSGSECEPKIASPEWNKSDVAPRTQCLVRAEMSPWPDADLRQSRLFGVNRTRYAHAYYFRL